MSDRFNEHKLTSERKPKYVFDYWVTGRGYFPFDMLRYDACWPVDSDSATRLYEDDEWRGERSVHLKSFQAPTLDRWSSFLWSVSATDPTPKPSRILS